MNLSATRSSGKIFSELFSKIKIKPGMLFGLIILTALIAFEIFNYSTTDYALRDLLGDLRFLGIRWATILSIAFCGIDFAGIARLFTPEQGADEPKEVWYLFGAWLLAATMNAVLTWWGVSMAIANHSVASTAVVDAETLTKIVPIFVSLMVWVIRILIIGSLSVAGERLFSDGARTSNYSSVNQTRSGYRPSVASGAAPIASANMSPRPTAINRNSVQAESNSARPEPTYHSVGARAAAQPSNRENHQVRL